MSFQPFLLAFGLTLLSFGSIDWDCSPDTPRENRQERREERREEIRDTLTPNR